ncbi:Cell filamentation protein (Filamentation induced by cAMP protein Fic) [Alteracholeplasma palmae J233]|uniref:Cell filamentation protein (Filamentation induced by cAMP protein Fic) n=1 Tax=Alteracholeplasma palmae (strain ATCC 49389 / J233) TaxID=1318466 RepID=U4KK41_ALTPJ|nr:Fic family protein [Alteracholeplasma palmae]CCV63999.1 Cell filamentation protein (Filamentation induced by cAMP protein Fic) [Alteracholeplasma palmae J233]
MEKGLLESERLHYNELRGMSEDSKCEQIEHSFLIQFIFDMMSLDGKCKLTKEEIAHLIDKKIIVSTLSEREQKEVLNLVSAYEFIKKLTIQRRRMSEELLKDIHEILFDGILQGGRYRNVNLQLSNSRHQPPDYVKVYDRMKKYFFDLERFRGTTVEKAAFAHAGLSKIHPFIEGNQRLARLIMNYYLLFDGYIALTIEETEKNEYMKSIDTFKEEKDLESLISFLIKKLLERYNDLIDVLESTYEV